MNDCGVLYVCCLLFVVLFGLVGFGVNVCCTTAVSVNYIRECVCSAVCEYYMK